MEIFHDISCNIFPYFPHTVILEGQKWKIPSKLFHLLLFEFVFSSCCDSIMPNMENKPKFTPDPELKLMDQVREVMRYHHLAYRTERTYCRWIYATSIIMAVKPTLKNLEQKKSNGSFQT